MVNLFEITVSGILLGAVYGLGALGMSLVFGVMGILNLAHGAFMILGGVTVWTLVEHTGIGLMAAIPLGFVMIFAVGLLLGRWGISIPDTPARGESGMDALSSSLLVTLGLTLIIDDLVARWGSQGVYSLPLDNVLIHVAGARFSAFNVMILGIVLAIFTVFSLLLRFSDFGKMVRACTQDKQGAILMGVSYRRVATAVFALGCAMAGLAGGFYLMLYPIRAHMSMPLTIKALLVVVLGGMGRVFHAFLAALFLGLVEVFTGFWGRTESQAMVPYMAMVAVLLLWPEGIGRRGYPSP